MCVCVCVCARAHMCAILCTCVFAMLCMNIFVKFHVLYILYTIVIGLHNYGYFLHFLFFFEL